MSQFWMLRFFRLTLTKLKLLAKSPIDFFLIPGVEFVSWGIIIFHPNPTLSNKIDLKKGK